MTGNENITLTKFPAGSKNFARVDSRWRMQKARRKGIGFSLPF